MRYGLCSDPGRDRSAFPAQSSVLDEQALLLRVVAQYDIGNADNCRFLTRGDSDVYTVTTDDGAYFLRIYRPPHTRQLAEAEARCVTALAQKGISVVPPVARRDGAFSSELNASEGRRPLLLFEEAPPPLPQLVVPSLAEDLGSAVSALHQAADELRDQFNLRHQTAENVAELFPFCRPYVSSETYEYLDDVMSRVRRRLSEPRTGSSDVGLCHGDLVLSNFRCHPERGLTFFDFGNALYTWRATELAVFRLSLEKRTGELKEDLWDRFLSGYAQVRRIPPQLDALLPLFLLARQIGWIGANCASLPLRLGTESIHGEFLARALEDVRRLEMNAPGLG